LGRNGVAFLNRCRKKFGDVFTLNLVGQKMTFLFEPQMIETVFKAPDSQITFRPAVEQFTQRVFGLPSTEFFPQHSKMLMNLRHLLVPGRLKDHADQLIVKFHEHAPALLSGDKVDLVEAVKRLVFRAATDTLFGPSLAANVQAGHAELERQFFQFEHGFELAASPVPHLFQPAFVSARRQVLSWLRITHTQGGFKGTMAGDLIERSELPDELSPNLLLAVLWASQANTVAATFWALAMLLLPSNNAYKEQVLTELQQKAQELSKQADNVKPEAAGKISSSSKDSEEDPCAAAAFALSMDRRSAISRCVAEAIRLRVQSIEVRIAAADIEMAGTDGNKVKLPKGRILAVCPFESHHDSRLYGPDAWTFNPDRNPMTLGDGSAVVHSVAGLAFGGGPYRCPGRFFAEMEVALLVQLLLHHYSFELQPSSSSSSAASGHVKTEPPPWLDMVAPLLRSVLGDAGDWGLDLYVTPPDSTEAGSSGACGSSDNAGSRNEAAASAGDALGAASTSGPETWSTSGDPDVQLPPCDLRRLVGIKVPARPWWVRASKAAAK